MSRDLSSWIEQHAANSPDRIAIRFEGSEISYRALHAQVLGCANYLHNIHGIGPGDRVSYLGLNTPECVIALFACAKLGAIYLPLNWRLALPELDYVLGSIKPQIRNPVSRANPMDVVQIISTAQYLSMERPVTDFTALETNRYPIRRVCRMLLDPRRKITAHASSFSPDS